MVIKLIVATLKAKKKTGPWHKSMFGCRRAEMLKSPPQKNDFKEFTENFKLRIPQFKSSWDLIFIFVHLMQVERIHLQTLQHNLHPSVSSPMVPSDSSRPARCRVAGCWRASVCQSLSKECFHPELPHTHTSTHLHTPPHTSITSTPVLLHLLHRGNTQTQQGRLLNGAIHGKISGLVRGNTHTHTHTHTCMNMELKGRTTNKHTVVHWKHLRWTHTHIHSFFLGARRLSFLTAAPYIARKRNFTLNFSTRSFSRSRKRRKARREKKKDKTLNTSVFLAAGERGDASTWKNPPSPSVFLPPTAAGDVFRLRTGNQGAKLWVSRRRSRHGF